MATQRDGRDQERRSFDFTMNEMVGDMSLLLAKMRRRNPSRPLIALGHSLGATVILRSSQDFDAMVLWEPSHSSFCSSGDFGAGRVWEPALNCFIESPGLFWRLRSLERTMES
jgi:predicted alpha/beta hydrolase